MAQEGPKAFFYGGKIARAGWPTPAPLVEPEGLRLGATGVALRGSAAAIWGRGCRLAQRREGPGHDPLRGIRSPCCMDYFMVHTSLVDEIDLGVRRLNGYQLAV